MISEVAASPLSRLVLLDEYREARANILKSRLALEWLKRQHKGQLIERGALVMIAGRYFADVPKMDAAIADLGRQAAERRLAAAKQNA